MALGWGHAIALYEGAGWEVGELMESRDRGGEVWALSEQVAVTETGRQSLALFLPKKLVDSIHRCHLPRTNHSQ